MRAYFPIRDRIEAALSDILATELEADGAAKLYVVLQSELRITINENLGGCACPYFSTLPPFRAAVGSRWMGQGPIILVNDQHCEDDRQYFKLNELLLAKTAAHEAGHVVGGPRTFIAEPIAAAESDELVTFLAQDPLDRPKPLHDLAHGPPWIRSTLHIQHRLAERGIKAPTHMAIRWDTYGYRDGQGYIDALQCELHDQQERPIREILATSTPQRFSDLYFADFLARYEAA